MDLKGLGSDDNSLIAERLAYELNLAFGTLSARTAYARLTVNDEYIGTYMVVESIPDVVTRRFANNRGNLYLLKNTSRSPNGLDAFALASENPTDPRSYIGDERQEHKPFEMPFGKFDGRDIVDLIQAFNQATPGAIRLAVSSLLNLDTLIDYLAVDMALTNTDGLLSYDERGPGKRVYYNKNTFFYHDPTTTQFFVMPYDLDAALDAFYPDSFTRDLRDGWDQMRITRLLLNDPSLMNQYFDRVRAFVNQLYDPDFIIQWINDLADQIRPALVEDLSRTTTPPRGMTIDDWENRVDRLRQYIRKRAGSLQQQLSRLDSNEGK
jgi:spore coat protein CotH